MFFQVYGSSTQFLFEHFSQCKVFETQSETLYFSLIKKIYRRQVTKPLVESSSTRTKTRRATRTLKIQKICGGPLQALSPGRNKKADRRNSLVEEEEEDGLQQFRRRLAEGESERATNMAARRRCSIQILHCRINIVPSSLHL